MGLIQDSLNNLILAATGGFVRVAGAKKGKEISKSIGEISEKGKEISESIRTDKPTENKKPSFSYVSAQDKINAMKAARGQTEAEKRADRYFGSLDRIRKLTEEKTGTRNTVANRRNIISALSGPPFNPQERKLENVNNSIMDNVRSAIIKRDEKYNREDDVNG